LLTGHLFEQGLVDNASGVTVALSTSAILQELRGRAGVTFRRGLANFHSQECYGVLALKAFHPEIPRRCFAHLNLDQTGRGGLALIQRPGLLASAGISGFVLRLILERANVLVPTCRYEVKDEFEINCTILAEPALGGVSTSLLEQRNPEWHTSHDRGGAQRLDRDMLRFVTLAAATWAYFLVVAGDEEAKWLLSAYKRDVRQTLDTQDVPDTQIYLEVKRQEMHDIAALTAPDRVGGLLEEVDRFIEEMNEVDAKHLIVPRGTREEVERSKRLFPRTVIGGPAVETCFTRAQLQDIGSPKWSTTQLVLKSWADGHRSIYEIARRAIYETGTPLSLGYALAFFEHYARQGLVSLDPQDRG
jgi:hypothetical protein